MTSSLEIVDVSISDDKPHTVIDFKLRNPSREICYIKQVDFYVDQVGVIETHPRGYRLQFVTATYDIDFDPRATPPYVDSWLISQVVDANNTDRFELRISYPEDFNSIAVRYVLVRGHFELIYNAANKIVSTEPLLFSVRPPRIILGERTVQNSEEVERNERNRRVHERMLNLSGIASPSIQRLRTLLAR